MSFIWYCLDRQKVGNINVSVGEGWRHAQTQSGWSSGLLRETLISRAAQCRDMSDIHRLNPASSSTLTVSNPLNSLDKC